MTKRDHFKWSCQNSKCQTVRRRFRYWTACDQFPTNESKWSILIWAVSCTVVSKFWQWGYTLPTYADSFPLILLYLLPKREWIFGCFMKRNISISSEPSGLRPLDPHQGSAFGHCFTKLYTWCTIFIFYAHSRAQSWNFQYWSGSAFWWNDRKIARYHRRGRSKDLLKIDIPRLIFETKYNAAALGIMFALYP